MLLVDDDEPDVGQRGDDGQPRPDDDIHVAGPDAPPLVGALAVAETRVDEGDPRVEICPQPVDERERQGDLGDQDERRPARLERRGDRLHVDRGLATAGDAIEQERTRIAGPDRGERPPRPPPPGRAGDRSSADGRRATPRVGWPTAVAVARGRRHRRALVGRAPRSPRGHAGRRGPPRAPPRRARQRAPGALRSGEVRDGARSRIAGRQRRRGVAAGRREADPALVPRARPGAAQRPLQADPAGRGHRPQAAQQPGPSVGAGQVADRPRAAFELRQQVRFGRVVRHARRGARTGGRRRELGDQVEPFEQARRQHRPEDEGRRREVVAGDPAREPERQERQERTVRPDPVGDRLGRDRRQSSLPRRG